MFPLSKEKEHKLLVLDVLIFISIKKPVFLLSLFTSPLKDTIKNEKTKQCLAKILFKMI